MTPTRLTFRGDAITAAQHLLTHPPLADKVGPDQPIKVINHRAPAGTLQTLEVAVSDRWRWSTGEESLLRILSWLADIDTTTMDEHCARLALTALTLRFGGVEALRRVEA